MWTGSFFKGPDWTASKVLRPWSGPSSNTWGGLASPDGLRPRLEVDGVVGMTADSSGPLCSSIGRRVTVSGSSGDGTSTFAQRQTRTGMRRVIVIAVRRPTLPGSACAHRGGAAGFARMRPGPGRSWPVPGRWLLQPQAVPASGERRRRNVSAHPAQVRQSLRTVDRTHRRKQINQTRPAAGSAAVPLATLSPRGRPPDQWSPSPLASTPVRLPARLRGAGGSCGAQRGRPP
jgi:hypothetical protein